MGTLAMKTQGVVVRIGTTQVNPVGDTFTVIEEIQSIGDFGPEAPIIDTTDLDDTARTKLKGIPDVGDIELTFNRSYQDAGQQALLAAGKANEDLGYNFEIEFDDTIGTNNTKIEFKAIVSSFKTNGGEVDGVVKGSATLAVTGDTTETVAT